jgi:peroxiredoxin
LRALGAVVLGISTDATWSHLAFAASLGISFPLLADDSPPGAAAGAFGIYSATRGRSQRALFVLDAARVIRWATLVSDEVNPGVDAALTALESLATPAA